MKGMTCWDVLLTYGTSVPVALGILATCYREQEMFKEAENIRQIQLSLLDEEPERNEGLIIRGQASFKHCYVGRLERTVFMCCSIILIRARLYGWW
jgi:hypothetical protein